MFFELKEAVIFLIGKPTFKAHTTNIRLCEYPTNLLARNPHCSKFEVSYSSVHDEFTKTKSISFIRQSDSAIPVVSLVDEHVKLAIVTIILAIPNLSIYRLGNAGYKIRATKLSLD